LLHQLPAAQSPSTLQPPAGSHVPATLHAPDRHTLAPAPAVQGPSPVAKPHLPSESQTPLVHTSAPTGAVQVPLSTGLVCGASIGNATPLASVAWHAFALSSHQVPVGHAESLAQPTTVRTGGPSSGVSCADWI
jgi:hypothetical protein